MDKLGSELGNINVTLSHGPASPDDWAGLEFPCPLCGALVPILKSKRGKPYCTCNSCGVQIFVRGKVGITRLGEMAIAGIQFPGKEKSTFRGIALYNYLERLKLQKRALEQKNGIIFSDENVENVIQIVDAEIKKVEGELAAIARESGKGTEK